MRRAEACGVGNFVERSTPLPRWGAAPVVCMRGLIEFLRDWVNGVDGTPALPPSEPAPAPIISPPPPKEPRMLQLSARDLREELKPAPSEAPVKLRTLKLPALDLCDEEPWPAPATEPAPPTTEPAAATLAATTLPSPLSGETSGETRMLKFSALSDLRDTFKLMLVTLSAPAPAPAPTPTPAPAPAPAPELVSAPAPRPPPSIPRCETCGEPRMLKLPVRDLREELKPPPRPASTPTPAPRPVPELGSAIETKPEEANSAATAVAAATILPPSLTGCICASEVRRDRRRG